MEEARVNPMKYLIIVALFVCGCASLNKQGAAQLVVPWSQDLANGESPTPFLAKYHQDETALYYLAASHSNKKTDPTFRMIEKTMAVFPAKIILLEGFETSKGQLPKTIVQDALKDGKSGHFFGGESAFTIQLAMNKKIPFIGLEPDESTIVSYIESQKYTKTDLAYLYFLRQLPQWIRAGTFRSKDIEKDFAAFMGQQNKKLKANVSLEYSHFLSWYKVKNKEDFKVTRIDSEKTAPVSDGTYFTQKLSAVVGMARDQHMVRLMEQELKDKELVFVVVGGSHWMTQKAALESFAGFPGFEFRDY
jgi:hypothetical protein